MKRALSVAFSTLMLCSLLLLITVGTTKALVVADINGDGSVDIYDVIILAGAFGSEPGDPRWNPDADLNSNLIIDIYDAIILAGNFQKTV